LLRLSKVNKIFMKSFLATIICVASFVSCAQTQSSDNIKIPQADKGGPSANEAIADFSEGCFWHAEIVFQSLVGVRDAVSGYAGGTTTDPDYEKVSTGKTGHAETVQVYYDPSKISYETLVKAYFASEDPTQVNGQGNDVGTEYRSIIFYRNTKEKQIIDSEIKRLSDSKKYDGKIVTQVVPYIKFYKAEDYHQEYIANHPDNPYVQNVSIPEFQKFREEFKGNFKQ
jgi:peptide-methionine (S)-S-oxide reductase